MSGRRILPGTYGCVAGSGWTGKVIEHGTASPYRHAFVVVSPGWVLEARPGGVGTAPLEPYIRKGAVFNDEEPLTDAQRRGIVHACEAAVGAPYDWAAIFNLALRVLGSKSELLPVGQHDSYICSQFVTVMSTKAGVIYCPQQDRWTVSPRTLADRITSRAWEYPLPGA